MTTLNETTHRSEAEVWDYEFPADVYYYLALTAGVIGLFAAFIPIMPIFTIVFTYKAYVAGARYKAGVILSILNVMASLFMFCWWVILHGLLG